MSGPEALLVPAIPGRFSLRSSRDDTTASLDWSNWVPVTGGATLVGSIHYSEGKPEMDTKLNEAQRRGFASAEALELYEVEQALTGAKAEQERVAAEIAGLEEQAEELRRQIQEET